MLDILERDAAFVSFTYSDGSVKVILSTLSDEILNKFGILPKKDLMYDFLKKEYIDIPTDVKISVTSEMPELDPVNAFALNFI